LAKLAGGVAVISVGAATEVEMKEKQERVKDAVEATKAAVEEGILPGGGIALIKAKRALDKVDTENEEEKIGVEIVKYALEQPLRWLARNAGQDEGYVVSKIEESLDKGEVNYGFNALTGKFENLIKAGVVDPLKVARSAIENAVSIGSMVLTTEVLITDLPEKEDKAPAGTGTGMPGMGM